LTFIIWHSFPKCRRKLYTGNVYFYWVKLPSCLLFKVPKIWIYKTITFWLYCMRVKCGFLLCGKSIYASAWKKTTQENTPSLICHKTGTCVVISMLQRRTQQVAASLPPAEGPTWVQISLGSAFYFYAGLRSSEKVSRPMAKLKFPPRACLAFLVVKRIIHLHFIPQISHKNLNWASEHATDLHPTPIQQVSSNI
jgi:hypothetical protein